MERINQDVKSGNTTYYITLKNNSQLIFTGTSKISSELPLTVVGDKISIYYDKTDSNIISISEFDNENIGKKENTTKEESNKDDSSTKDEESENTSKDTSENK